MRYPLMQQTPELQIWQDIIKRTHIIIEGQQGIIFHMFILNNKQNIMVLMLQTQTINIETMDYINKIIQITTTILKDMDTNP